MDMDVLLTRQLKEYHGKITTLLEIFKILGGNAPPTQNETEADRKAKKWENWLKLCNPNGYCFSCGY